MHIGILGGTFNPPHLAHRHIAGLAVDELDLIDVLYVVPAAEPPHKEISISSPIGSQRLEMTELNFEGLNNVIVSDMEFRRPGPSYTVDTLIQIRDENPNSELFLIMGADMFLSITKWHRYEDILAMCTPIVFAREEGQREALEGYAREIAGISESFNIVIAENEVKAISSSELRESLVSREGENYLAEPVYEYIIRNRLYGSKPNLDWLRERAHAMLSEKRTEHVFGCEEEARKLAIRWGADEDDAAEAAILHDIAKNKDLKQQLILCEKYGIIADKVERENVKLLHAKTGAEISNVLFGVSGEVHDAIRWHTTGRANMGLLEQIIYIADYIEPTRDFPGVEKLRELAYIDLGAALKLGLEMTVGELAESGKRPHRHTIEALNWLDSLGV